MGDFTGWRGRTTFQLENGTQWIQQNRTDSYDYSPPLHAPMVKISPASMGGFWLEFKGVNSRIRVLPLPSPEKQG